MTLGLQFQSYVNYNECSTTQNKAVKQSILDKGINNFNDYEINTFY